MPSSIAADDLAEISETDVSEFRLIRGRFSQNRVRKYLRQVFSDEEVCAMKNAGVDRRMIFGVNAHYHALATGGGLTLENGTRLLPDMPPSKALLALIMPRLKETLDMRGEKDPSNQSRYTPDALAGRILHKYDEIVLAHTLFSVLCPLSILLPARFIQPVYRQRTCPAPRVARLHSQL
ncbi:MAG: hypothetical protein H6715_00170 [Myxococcales bacterium]|nr:hypothetical protein [Myxococcales bacterium]MCB9707379.1 hypothetical protein [Myxococcales bacterium]